MARYELLSIEDREHVRAYARSRENFGQAVFAGVMVSLSCSFVWYAISMATGFKTGLVAVGIGIVVGYTVWFSGKGISERFGILGMGLAFSSVALGHLLIAEFFLRLHHPSLYNFKNVLIMAYNTLGMFDIVFAFIAAFEGFKFGMRSFSDIREDLVESGEYKQFKFQSKSGIEGYN